MTDRTCIIHIYSSYNNVLMNATDLTGAEMIAKCTGGQVVKKGSDKGSQFAATRAAERIAEAILFALTRPPEASVETLDLRPRRK